MVKNYFSCFIIFLMGFFWFFTASFVLAQNTDLNNGTEALILEKIGNLNVQTNVSKYDYETAYPEKVVLSGLGVPSAAVVVKIIDSRGQGKSQSVNVGSNGKWSLSVAFSEGSNSVEISINDGVELIRYVVDIVKPSVASVTAPIVDSEKGQTLPVTGSFEMTAGLIFIGLMISSMGFWIYSKSN